MANPLAGLNSRPKANYRATTAWPPGKRQRLTRQLAKRIFDAMAVSTDSLYGLLHANPDFPPHDQFYSWQKNIPWFAEGFRDARKRQADFFVQHCLELARQANPKNAHAIRVKYDIFKWIASKFSPEVYGDKPAQTAVNVAVGFNVSTQRLEEIRGKLDMTRNTLKDNHKVLSNGNRTSNANTDTQHSNDISVSPPLIPESSTHGNNHDEKLQ